MLGNDVKLIREVIKEIKREEEILRNSRSALLNAEQGINAASDRLKKAQEKLNTLLTSTGLSFPPQAGGLDKWAENFRQFCTMLEEQATILNEREMRRGE